MNHKQSEIITFYSYKGGVGRSMVLANVAWILASNGKRVLVIDWDLEAPGLHRYFLPFLDNPDLSETEGLIDFLINYTDAAMTPSTEEDENWYKPYTNILHYAVSLEWEQFIDGGTIDFVPAGKQDQSYATKVSTFDWQNFYERLDGGAFFEAVKEKIREEYDYILIDSRTGVSDTSGICTVQMPDKLAIFFTANNQSILGAAGVATSVEKQWRIDENKGKNKLCFFPVLSRTDRTEKVKFDLAREYAQIKFSPFLRAISKKEQKDYWGNVEIPYFPWYAYEEVLATFGDDSNRRESLLAAIEQLVCYLTENNIRKLNPPEEQIRKKILDRFIRTEIVNESLELRKKPSFVATSQFISSIDLFSRLKDISSDDNNYQSFSKDIENSICSNISSDKEKYKFEIIKKQ